jgi:uncharacterized delta-60 repeat protein
VSDASLVATIDIDAGATPDDFDIVVANADGRTGKGTELFAVLAKIDPCTLPDPLPTLSPYTTGAPGQPGWFDSTFGGGTGKVIGPRDTQMELLDEGDKIAVDDADRVIVVGHRSFPCSTQSGWELIAMRYLPDGSPDPSFGTNGLAAVSFGGGSGMGKSVVVQADGKIVIGGQGKQSKSTGMLPVIIRLDEHGALDPTFGSGGFFWITLFGTKANGAVAPVTLQAAGTVEKVVAAGWSNAGPRFVLRLNANGTLDTTFNGTGYSLWNNVKFNAVRVESVGADRRILVAGMGLDTLGKQTATLWRFTGSGALDTSFGGGTGIVQTWFPVEDGTTRSGENFHALAIDNTSRILAVGHSDFYLVPGDVSTIQNRVVLARYDENGVPDPSFGTDGSGRVWALRVLGKDVSYAVTVQGDDRVLVAGDTRASQNDEGQLGVLWRLNPDGTSDTTFGAGGWITDGIVGAPRGAYWRGMKLQSDGRVVCAGGFTVDHPDGTAFSYIALARFWQ